MAADGVKLGSGYVEMEARVENAEAAIAAFESRFQQATTNVTSSANKIGDSMQQAGTEVATGSKKGSDGLKELERWISRVEREAEEATQELREMAVAAANSGGKVQKASKGIASGLGKAEKTATGLQSGLGKLLIPAAVAASVKGLVDTFIQAEKVQRELIRGFDDMGRSAQEAAHRATAGGAFDENLRQQQDFLFAAQDQARQANEQLETYLSDTSSLWSRFKIGVVDLFAEGDQSRQAVVDSMIRAEEEAFKASRKRIEAFQREQNQRALDESKALVDGLEAHRMDSIERIEAEEEDALAELYRLRQNASDEQTLAELDARRAAIREEFAQRRHEQVATHLEEMRLAEERKQQEFDTIKEQAEQLERSLLGVHEQNKLNLQDQIEDARQKIASIQQSGEDATRDGADAIKDLMRVIAALETKFDIALKNQKEAQEQERRDRADLPEEMRRAVSGGFEDALSRRGLLSIPADIGDLVRFSRQTVRELQSNG